MFRKKEIIIIFIIALCFRNLLASPPMLKTDSPKANGQIIVLEQPQLDKWTKVKIKARALNEDWQGRDIPVYLNAERGLLIKPSGKNVKWWKNIKQGSDFETEFEIMPYLIGTIAINIEFGQIMRESHYLVLDESLHVTFNGTWEDIYKLAGERPDYNNPEHPYSTEVEKKLNIIFPKLHEIKPTITEEKVIFRKKGIIFEISPPPGINQKSKVKIIVQPNQKESGLNVTVGSKLKADISHISKWKKRAENHLIEFTITPRQIGDESMDIYFKPARKSAYVYNIFYTIGDNGKLKSAKNNIYDKAIEVLP